MSVCYFVQAAKHVRVRMGCEGILNGLLDLVDSTITYQEYNQTVLCMSLKCLRFFMTDMCLICAKLYFNKLCLYFNKLCLFYIFRAARAEQK